LGFLGNFEKGGDFGDWGTLGNLGNGKLAETI
jgi:hypothetical protein